MEKTEYSFCSYMGPNQERIMDQMAIRLSTYEGIGQRLIKFCVYVSVVVRRFATDNVCLFTVYKHFASFQASFD